MATTMHPATGETTKQLINYRVDSGVAVIEMNDPPANTYTYEMNRQLDDAILKARMANDVYVILLTGAGDKFFSAGANIKMLASVDPTFKYYFCLHANEMLLRLEHTPKLVIAAINGHCVGGGLEIAMAADIRIARKDAGKIGLPEVNLGVLPGTGGTQRLSRLVGKSKAIELMVTGNTFSFEEAKDLGIVNDIFERDGFMENIMEYARQFTPPNKAAKAVGRIKRAVQTGWEIPMESALAVERENQQILFQSEDAKEGLAAYVEKRPAEFKAKYEKAVRHQQGTQPVLTIEDGTLRVSPVRPRRLGGERIYFLYARQSTQKSEPSAIGKDCSTSGARKSASIRKTSRPSTSTRSTAPSKPTTSSSAPYKGRRKWENLRQVPTQQMRDALMNMIVYQGDTEFASVEQQRNLFETAPTDWDRRALTRVMIEEMRHGWQMCALLMDFFGYSGKVEAQKMLERRAFENKRLLGTFNVDIDNWLDFFTYTDFVDRDGKFQLQMLKYSVLRAARTLDLVHAARRGFPHGHRQRRPASSGRSGSDSTVAHAEVFE